MGRKPHPLIIEAVPKLQFLEQQLMKTAVLQPIGRKTSRACYKITDFGTGSIRLVQSQGGLYGYF
jgi:hypothetical protein